MTLKNDLAIPPSIEDYPLQWTRNIWLLGVREFPSFLVVGEKACALIEAGVSVLARKLSEDINSLNLSVPLKYLIAAHAHADHVNGLIKLKQMLPDLSLVGLKETADILGKEKIIHNLINEDALYTKYLSNLGIITESIEKLSGGPMQFDLVMDHQQTLDLGNLELQFLQAPGHAPGNTVIRVKQNNAFLISDTAGYANAIDDILPLFFHNYIHYLDSLNVIKNLEPDYIGLGHNLILSGKLECMTFLDQAIRSAQEMKEQIVSDIHNRLSPEKIESALADKMVRFGLFKSFSEKTLMSLSKLLIRRAVE